MEIRFNLTQKFIGFLLLTSVLPLLAVGISSYQVSRKTLQGEAIKYTAELISNQTDYLDLQLKQIESLITNISGVDEIVSALESAPVSPDVYTSLATQARIGYILNGYTSLQGLISIDIFTPAGAHYYVGDTLDSSDIRNSIKNRILVQALQVDQHITWIGIEDNVNANSSAEKVITAAKVLYRTNTQTLQTEPIALLLVNYSVDYLYDHFKQINLGRGAFLVVVDAQHRIIYHPHKQLLGTSINPALANLLTGRQGNLVQTIDQQKMLISYTRSELSDWVVLSMVPLETLVTPTASIGSRTSLAIAIALLISLIAAWVVSTLVVKPIRQITRRFKLFQEGSLDWQVPLVIHGRDEISELGTWFNTFLASLMAQQQAETALRESVERERATLRVVERMRQTLDLEEIFQVTTHELQDILECDRVAIFQFQSESRGLFVAEARLEESCHLAQPMVTDARVSEGDRSLFHLWEQAEEGRRYFCIEDVDALDSPPCCADLLQSWQVRAYLIVPILQGQKLWGLLISAYADTPHGWEPGEIHLLIHISTQFGIALQQIELFTHIQQQSADLEKARDAAEAASRAKSEFLANVSHELRTPLNAILGFCQVMSYDPTLNQTHQDSLAIIHRSGQHLLSLINDVLEMTKIEAGRGKLSETSFDLYFLLDTLEDMLRLKASTKHLTFLVERAPDLPRYITGDENKLRQVLLNLLDNAIKFTRQGRVELRIRVEPPSGQGLPPSREQDTVPFPSPLSPPALPGMAAPHSPLHLFFDVIDTGPGIAPEEVKHLFKAFVQTKVGQQTSEGTGLGLALSRKFVRLMGGDITVGTVLGQGSTFSFDIWVRRAFGSARSTAIEVQRVIGLAPNHPLYRVLIVEDHWANSQVLCRLLEPLGFEMRIAQQGEAGIEQWEQWKPHLIFMDLRMPVMDGYAATRYIREREKQDALSRSAQEGTADFPGAKTVIIALTASAFEETRVDVLAAGCDDFLRKPIQKEILLAKVAEHLGVTYLYERSEFRSDEEPEMPSRSTLDELVADLTQMPMEWKVHLREAAIKGFDEQISQLLEQIPVQYPDLIQALTSWNNEFQFKKIIDLIEQGIQVAP